MSNIYSLLNYIAATCLETSATLTGRSSVVPTYPDEHDSINSLASGLQDWNDDQRRLVAISTISVVTQLALEFKVDEVLGQFDTNALPR
jgi:phosphatidylinositol 4-kinase A